MNFLQRAISKAFRIGPTAVSPWEAQWGREGAIPFSTAYAELEPSELVQVSSPVYACATLRSKNLAKLPLRAYRRGVRGDRVEVTSGPLIDLLGSVNPHWTFRRLLRMTEMSLCVYGQAFWVLEGGKPGKPPNEIWWANPTRMRVQPHPERYIGGFVYDDSTGAPVHFPPEDVIWIKYDNPADEWSGLSPLAAARMGIETSLGAQRSNRSIFANGMQLTGILGPVDKNAGLTREQAEQLSQLLERRFRGPDKAHRIAVMTQPVGFTQLALTPKDAEFLGLMAWGMRDVAMVMGVPPELIGDHEHATYSNIDAAMKSLWTDTLIPEATLIADELTEQLVPRFGPEVTEVEFDFSDIETLQEDRSELITQVTQLVGVGVPLNKVLQELAPRFLPSGKAGYPWGDVAWLSGGLQPISKVPEDTQSATAASGAPAGAKAPQRGEGAAPLTSVGGGTGGTPEPMQPAASAPSVEELAAAASRLGIGGESGASAQGANIAAAKAVNGRYR